MEETKVEADVEVLDVANTPDEDTGDDLDEEVIPPVEETTPEGEPEKPDVKPVEETPVPSQEKKPAPVEGETPREKALRLEVQRLKHLRREEGVHEIVGSKPVPVVNERLAKLKERYTPEELQSMEEAVDVIAASKGYVKAEESYKASVNTLVEEFIEANPEYKPENDPEDVRWSRFEAILKSDYNTQGKTLKQLNVIFKKAHQDVINELGEPTATVQEKRDAAQRQKIKSVSHSGGTKTPVSKPESPIPPSVRSVFKGFDDEDFEE